MKVWDEVDGRWLEIETVWSGTLHRQDEKAYGLAGDLIQRHAPMVGTRKKEWYSLPSQRDVRNKPGIPEAAPLRILIGAEFDEYKKGRGLRRQRVQGRCRACGTTVSKRRLSRPHGWCETCRSKAGRPQKESAA